MSAHISIIPASPLTRHTTRMALRTLHDAVDAGHPDAATLVTLIALAAPGGVLDRSQQDFRAAVIEAAADEAQRWLDGGDERAFGSAVDAAREWREAMR